MNDALVSLESLLELLRLHGLVRFNVQWRRCFQAQVLLRLYDLAPGKVELLSW